jgi:hypothetical protein
MEVRIEQKTFKVVMKCSKCKEGEMVFTGFSRMSSPPLNSHECNKCGAVDTYLGTKYPRFEYEDLLDNPSK